MRGETGLSAVEMMVTIVVILMAMSAVTGLLIHSSEVNRSQQMAATMQADARSCLAMIVQKLRSAGWDPSGAGIATVVTDPDLSDNVSQIEVFADLDGNGDTAGPDEQILIRHVGDRIEWRRSSNVSDPFEILAVNISNDADGDGTPEPMFVPDATPDPSQVLVRITAQSALRDPILDNFVRYTVSSDVVLRKEL